MSYEPAEHYDRVTAAWRLLLGEDLHYGVFDDDHQDLPAATGRLTELMSRAAEIGADDDVLDIGCGTGGPACRLARDTGARVTGITTSRAGIEAARERAQSHGLFNRVVFEVRDGMSNGFPDRSFDRVWALESSHLMRDRDRFVAEAARVLRPGGRLALCDIVLMKPMGFEDVRRLLAPLALLREVFGDARMEPLAEYRRLAEGNGLEVRQVEDLTAVTKPTFTHWRANAAANRAEVVALLGLDYWDKFNQSCDILEGFWADGTLGYGLLTASRS